MSKLGSLVVEVVAEIRKYQADMNAAATTTEAAGTRVERVTGSMTAGIEAAADAQGTLAQSVTRTAVSMGVAGAAIAVGTAALAAYAAIAGEAAKENQAIVKALAMTGNQAGVTVGQLNDMARATSGMVGTQGQAVAALTSVAATGKVAAENMTSLTVTALNANRSLGQSVDDTVKHYDALADAPVKASLKLNEAMGYLTEGTYKRIKALEEQGKKDEAAALAQQTYATALDTAGKKVEASLGVLQKAWRGMGDAAKWAWDAVLNIGREDTLTQQLDKQRAAVNAVEAQIASRQKAGMATGDLDKQAAALRNRLEVLQLQDRAELRAADSVRQSNQYNQQRIDILGQVSAAELALMTNKQKLAKVTEGYDAQVKEGLMSQAERNTLVAAAQEKYAEKVGRSKVAVDEFAQALAKVQAKDAGLNGDYEKNLKALYEGYTQGRIGAEGYGHAVELLIKQQPFYVAGLKGQAKAMEMAQKAAAAYASDLDRVALADMDVIEMANRYTETVQERVRATEFEATLIGKSNTERAIALKQYQIDLELEKQILEIKKKLASQMEQDDAISAVTRAAQRAKANAAAEVVNEEFSRVAAQIEGSLTDALMRGFESGKSFAMTLRDTLVNMFKTLVLRPIVSAIVSPVSGAIASTLASTTATAATSGAVSGGLGASLGGFGMSVAEGFGVASSGVGSGVLASSGSFGFGVGQALAAIPGWGWALAGIALLATMLDDSGTMHTGGAGSYSAANGAQVTDATTLGFAKIDISVEAASASKSIAEAIGKTLDGVAKTFGKTAGYTIATAFADDSSRDGSWGSLVISKNGQKVMDWRDTQTSRWAPKEFADGEDGRKQYLAAVAKDVRDTLMAETPKWADDMLMALGDAPSIEALAGTVQEINGMQAAIVTMTMASSQFAAISEDGMAALIAAMGGAKEAVAGLQSYYQNFFSEDERRSVATRQVSDAMAALGLQMPATRDGFRALIEAQDLTTEAGRNTYAALIALSPAFAQVVASARASVADLTAGIASAVDDAVTQHNTAVRNAQSAALANLRSATEAEKRLYQQGRAVAAQLASEVRGIFEVLGASVRDLRAEAADPIASAEQAQLFIAAAVDAARTTGVLPDQQALTDAIAAARGGLSKNMFSSVAEQQFAQLKLAGELEVLQAISGDQLTAAEYAQQTADAQLAALDDQLNYWERQMNAAQGGIAATMSVTDAVVGMRVALTQALDDGFASVANIRTKALAEQLTSVAAQYSQGTTAASVGQLAASVTSGTIGLDKAVGFLAGTPTTSPLFEQQVNVSKNFTAAGYYAEIRQNLDSWINQGINGAALSQIMVDYGVSLTDAAKAYGVTAGDIAANLLRAGATNLPRLAVGTNYVPQDMLAMIHEGEAVIPKPFNPFANGGGDEMGAGGMRTLERWLRSLDQRMERMEGHTHLTAEHTGEQRRLLGGVCEGGFVRQKVVA